MNTLYYPYRGDVLCLATWLSIIHEVDVKQLHTIPPDSPIIPAYYGSMEGLPIQEIRKMLKPLFSYHCSPRFLEGITGHSFNLSCTHSFYKCKKDVRGGRALDWLDSGLTEAEILTLGRWASPQ